MEGHWFCSCLSLWPGRKALLPSLPTPSLEEFRFHPNTLLAYEPTLHGSQKYERLLYQRRLIDGVGCVLHRLYRLRAWVLGLERVESKCPIHHMQTGRSEASPVSLFILSFPILRMGTVQRCSILLMHENHTGELGSVCQQLLGFWFRSTRVGTRTSFLLPCDADCAGLGITLWSRVEWYCED